MANGGRSSHSGRRYGSFPTTADVGIWARGSNSRELFEALAEGLYALMTDRRAVRPRASRIVEASADDAPGLVVAFLTKLIVLEATEGFVGRDVEARPIGSPPTAILATVRGETFDPERHPRRKEVKAITMHRLEFDPEHGRAKVIVDI